MIDIRSIVKQGIEIKQSKENEKYDLLIDKVSKEDSIANMYYMIGEAYGNSLEQRELAIRYLKEALVGEYFSDAKVEGVLNGIEFYDDEYKVVFPTSRVRNIDIIDLKIEKVKTYHSLVSHWEHRLAELIEIYYFSNKSFSNLNTLRKHYINMGNTRNLIRLAVEFKETITECSLDKAMDIRRRESLDIERLACYEEEVKAHSRRQDDSLKFAHSLKSLKSFTDAGWTVTLRNMDRYGAVRKIEYK